MALDEAPPFWWKANAWQAWAMLPVSFFYGQVAARRMAQTSSAQVRAPVICVGNFIAGGAGKTPTVEMIARIARLAGFKPGILSRGHGGAITTPTVVNRDKHNSQDVGDEALLHAYHSTTVVSADRPAGAQKLIEQGCDLILMDDGFQNPSLHKDYSLVVVDAGRGLGNGFSIPAGPMRAPLKNQLILADAVFVIGEGEHSTPIIRKAARAGKAVFLGRAKPVSNRNWQEGKWVAYAGIADPEKFFETLAATGADIAEKVSFGDHHVFTDEECTDLLRKAQAQKANLVTTTKDAVRLRQRGEASTRLLQETRIFAVSLEPDSPDMVRRILKHAVRNYEKRMLSGGKTAA